MTEKKDKILVWHTNDAGKLGVKIDIALNIFPTVVLEDEIVEIPTFSPTLRFFIKEYRLAYETERLIGYLEDYIENAMYNIYPNNEVLAEQAAEAMAPHLIDFLTPYIQHVRENGLQEPEEENKSGLSEVDVIFKKEYLPSLFQQFNKPFFGEHVSLPGGVPADFYTDDHIDLPTPKHSDHVHATFADVPVPIKYSQGAEHYFDLLQKAYLAIPKAVAKTLPKGDE